MQTKTIDFGLAALPFGAFFGVSLPVNADQLASLGQSPTG
jgi:hypothetical protein